MLRAGFTLLRLAVLCALLAAAVSELPAWRARAAYAALPDYAFVAHAQTLLAQDRLPEASMVAQAGLKSADDAQRARLRDVLARIEARRTSVPYRLGQITEGALLGRAGSAWALGGALAADLFVFGDVRDLLIQGTHAVRDEPVDGLLVGLSALGLATTLSPVSDLGVDLLKGARRAGALSADMARALARMVWRAVRGGERQELEAVTGSLRRIERATGPGNTLAVLRRVDDPAMLPRVADFVEREPQGAFALWLSGGRGVAWLKRAGGGERDLVLAARKGPAGLAWLRSGGARLLHFHPVLGLAKGLYAGHVGRFLVRLFDGHLPVLLAVCGLWLLFECRRLYRRFVRVRPHRNPRAQLVPGPASR